MRVGELGNVMIGTKKNVSKKRDTFCPGSDHQSVKHKYPGSSWWKAQGEASHSVGGVGKEKGKSLYELASNKKLGAVQQL